MRQILFASDFSKASAKAFATVVTLAKVNRATVTILHVVVPFMPMVPEQYWATAKTWAATKRDPSLCGTGRLKQPTF
jgi:nucleotide-binding universal stress UspA family protein